MINLNCTKHQEPNCTICLVTDILGLDETIKKMRERKPKIELDYSQIEDVEVSDIYGWDAPDFSDAYISSATYMGREMTEDELDVLNDDHDYVYEKVQEQIY